MKPQTVMVVAGDPSGDALAAGLVRELSAALGSARFIGAGGPKMAEAGVRCLFDLTADAVIGLSDASEKLPLFRRRMRELTQLAISEKPELIVLVDYSGSIDVLLTRSGLPAVGIRKLCNTSRRRSGRRVRAAPRKWREDIDLLLCLFPFEKEWYRGGGHRISASNGSATQYLTGHKPSERQRDGIRSLCCFPAVVTAN